MDTKFSETDLMEPIPIIIPSTRSIKIEHLNYFREMTEFVEGWSQAPFHNCIDNGPKYYRTVNATSFSMLATYQFQEFIMMAYRKITPLGRAHMNRKIETNPEEIYTNPEDRKNQIVDLSTEFEKETKDRIDQYLTGNRRAPFYNFKDDQYLNDESLNIIDENNLKGFDQWVEYNQKHAI